MALTRVLHGRFIEAVAVGAMTAPSAIACLAAWADKVIVLQKDFVIAVPIELRHKILIWDIGPDRWSNPYNQELLTLLEGLVRERL